MSLFIRLAIGLPLWIAALYGVLQIYRIEGDWHGYCGPWGCGPPLQALITVHGFWLVLLGPPIVIAAIMWPGKICKRVGLCLTSLGLAGIIGIIVWQTVYWLPHFSSGEPTYFPQRCLFALATLIDVPIVPILLGGIILLCVPKRNSNCGQIPGEL